MQYKYYTCDDHGIASAPAGGIVVVGAEYMSFCSLAIEIENEIAKEMKRK